MNESLVRCDEVQSYLARHLAGRLGDRLSRTVHSYIRAHMLSCADCCEKFKDIEQFQFRPGDTPEESPKTTRNGSGIQTRVEEFWSRSRIFLGLAGIAALLLVAVFFQHQHRKSNVIANSTTATSPQPAPSLAADAGTPISASQVKSVALTRVSGRVLLQDGSPLPDTGLLNRVLLCCFDAVRSKRIFATVHSDGTFEFVGIPPGQYSAVLTGIENLTILNPAMDVTSEGVTGLQLIAVERLVPVEVTVTLDTGERLPYHPATTIVFTGNSGNASFGAPPVIGNLFQALLRANDSYSVSVFNIDDGYTVHSIVDNHMTDLLNGGRVAVESDSVSQTRVTITLSKK